MKILFICVANSARSQMAEGLARHLFNDTIEVFSAGSEPTFVNPFAIKAMAKMGIDINSHSSKKIATMLEKGMDLIITLCADEVCPIVPGTTKKLHWPFADPAAAGGDDEAKLAAFITIRDQIKAKLLEFAEEQEILR